MLGCLSAAFAENAGAPALDNRSPEWKKNLTVAVNDATKVAGVIQSMPEADRAAFATDVLGVLQSKRQFMADKVAWAKEYGTTVAALVTGAEGAKNAVLAAVAPEMVRACVTGESRELGRGDLELLGVLAKSSVSLLKVADRAAFANVLLQAVAKQKAADADVHKLAQCMTVLALVSGAGEAKKDVVAEVFATVELGDLGAVSEALSDAFNQRKNGLNNEEYMQVALQMLQAVAARTAGLPDAATRFAYAVSVFLDAAGNPTQFESDLMGKISGLLEKVGHKDSFGTALAAARADKAGNAALVQTIYPSILQRNAWGPIILQTGNLLGLPGVIVNRPPPPGGYQNQGI